MELDACKLDFENLQNYAAKLSNCAANSANYAEKNGCAVLVSASTGKVVYVVF